MFGNGLTCGDLVAFNETGLNPLGPQALHFSADHQHSEMGTEVSHIVERISYGEFVQIQKPCCGALTNEYLVVVKIPMHQ